MVGESYTLTGKEFGGSITYVFDLKGWLVSVGFNDLAEANHRWFLKAIPHNLPQVQSLREQLKGKVIIKKTPSDLSFTRFWDLYDMKASKKKECRELWDKFSDAEKVEILIYIPKYLTIKKKDNTSKMYGNTFLRSQNWK